LGLPIAAAFAYAGAYEADGLAYALIVALSVILGFACAGLLEFVRVRLAARIIQPSESVPGWYPPALYATAIVWMVIAWALGLRLASAVLRLVG
jgi:hypothetical protein